MYLHFKTQETENDQYLDGGSLGNERKLYYRELIARFSHNLALNWNLGEETTNTTSELQSYAQYFYDNDPYRHNVVLHTYPGEKDKRYGPLLGNASKLTGLSMQTSNSSFGQEHGDVLKWVEASENAGRPWVVAVDEPGDAGKALRPDNDAGNSHEDARKKALWGTFMGGGAGNEWYFGYQHAHSDLTCEDFRSRDNFWDYSRYALNFFNAHNVPFVSMDNRNELIGNSNNDNSSGYCFAKTGTHYVIYLPSGGSKNLNLNGVSGSFSVKWYDPRNGGSLKNGTVATINGGGNRSIGNAPNNTGKDWVVYVINKDLEGITEENGGYVVLEAESTDMVGKWIELDSPTVNGTNGFTGNGYIRYTGNTEVNGPANDVLTYKIRINNPGNYKLIIRGLEAPIETGEGDKANDCYVRMVGQSGNLGKFNKHVLLGNSYQWSWNVKAEFSHHTFTQPIYNLSAGVHEFQVAGRSKNFFIDRFVLYKDLTDNQAKDLSLENIYDPEDPEDPVDSIAYNATSDFSNITAGTVPYYKDNNNNALAIDASNTNYRNKFARAQRTFDGATGTYDVKIITLTEEDGESTYRLLVNGAIVKTYQNPYIGPGSSKYMGANSHTWSSVALNNGDTIAIESNTHTNGEIAEGSGTAWSRGRWRSIEFIPTDSTPDPVDPVVNSLTLINADTDQPIAAFDPIPQGATINLYTLPTKNISIRANASNAGSVRFGVDGNTNFQTESVAPYAIAGDTNGDYDPWSVSLGAHTVTATAYSESGAKGTASAVLTRNITIIDEAPPALGVTSINLINASTDTVVQQLKTGNTINKAVLPEFSFQALTTGTVGSVIFYLNGNPIQTENQSPYAAAGDTSGDYDPLDLPVGQHTIKATAFSGSNGSGEEGASVTITFNVVANSLPGGQSSSDIGTPGFKTLVTHSNGTYLISASGKDIWGKSDSFGFVHQNASGDLELTAKIESLTNTNAWAKAGVMMRESLDANSKHAMTVITPAKGASFQRRTSTGGNSSHSTIGGVKAPQWVKVIRQGNTFLGYFSANNNIWYPMGVANVSMKADVKVGLAVTSHDNTKETEALVTNYSVKSPSETLAVTRFVLVNADTDEDIRTLTHNSTINLATDGTNLNIRAEVKGSEESVIFHVNGSKFHTENLPVYAIGGNSGNDYKPWTPALGTLSIMATPYSQDSGSGEMGSSLAIVVNVVNNP